VSLTLFASIYIILRSINSTRLCTTVSWGTQRRGALTQFTTRPDYDWGLVHSNELNRTAVRDPRTPMMYRPTLVYTCSELSNPVRRSVCSQSVQTLRQVTQTRNKTRWTVRQITLNVTGSTCSVQLLCCCKRAFKLTTTKDNVLIVTMITTEKNDEIRLIFRRVIVIANIISIKAIESCH